MYHVGLPGPLLVGRAKGIFVYNLRPTDMEALAATRLHPERAPARKDSRVPVWLSRIADRVRLPKVRLVVAIRKEA